jgi:outer membrane protein assembly factor BamB
MATRVAASSALGIRRARFSLFTGLLLALALSAAPMPHVDVQRALATVGQRLNSLLPRTATPISRAGAATPSAPALPELDAPHEHIPNLYIKAPHTLYALNPATGATRWQHVTSEIPNLAPVQDVGVAVEEESSVTLLSGKTGAPLWRYAPSSGTIARLMAVYGDTVYAVETHTVSLDKPSDAADSLLALNDADGSVRWRYTVTHSHLGFVSIISSLDNPMIYINDDVADFRPTSGSITALSVNNGAVRWRRVLNGAPGLSPQYAVGDSVIAYAPVPQSMTNTGGVYFRLDMRTGAPIWTLPSAQRGSPVFTSTTLYLGGLKRLVAYDMTDLSVRWTATIQGTGAVPVRLSDQYIAVRTRTSFEVYEAASGKRLWSQGQPATFGVVRLVGSTLCTNSNTNPGSLTGFDIATGAQRWRYQSPAMLQPSMPLDGASIFVRTFADVFSFNPTTGAIRWQTPLDAQLDVQMDVTPA